VETSPFTLLIRCNINLFEENKVKWKVFNMINNSKVFLRELVSLDSDIYLGKLLPL